MGHFPAFIKKYFLTIFLFLSVILRTEAQCNGDVILTSQAQVNAFNCTSVGGDLIIEGGDIFDLDPIYDALFLTVGGRIIVRNCPALTSLAGLDGIQTCGGFEVLNCDALNTFGGFAFQMTAINGLLRIAETGLTTISNLNLLTTCQDITIEDNLGLITIDGVNSLPLCGSIRISLCPSLTAITGFNGLTTIENFTMEYCGDINDISGFQNLAIINSEFRFENNQVTGLVAAANFNLSGFNALTNVGERFYIQDNLILNSITGFASLVNVNFDMTISGNEGLTSITGFPNLGTIDGALLIDNNDDLVNLNAFNNVTGIGFGDLSISDNSSLTSIAGFNNLDILNGWLNITNNPVLSSINGFPALSYVYQFKIVNNPQLSAVSGFGDFILISEGITVTGNTSLSACCFLEPLIAVSEGSNFISSNASGCSSVSEITSGSPFMTCQTNYTINTDNADCSVTVTYTDPTPIDNCGVTQFNTLITDANGDILYNGPASPGFVGTYDLPQGDNTFIYYAADVSGNNITCTTVITVVDNVVPVWDDIDNTNTVFGICGVDNLEDMFISNVPIATDNCGIVNYVDNFVENTICGNSISRVYTSFATDLADNQSAPYILTLNLIDNDPPQIQGIPADEEISCDDVLPTLPTVTALDMCAGDLTNSVVMTTDITPGPCVFGEAANTYNYNYSVVDACGNTDQKTWKVTRINDFSFDLGNEIEICNGSQAVIDPGPIGAEYLWSNGETTQSITISNPGTYSVTITTANGCCNSDVITVVNGTAPNSSAIGAELDCTGAEVQIHGNSTTGGVAYAWSGPGGFTSAMQNPNVTLSGTYTLTVTASNGCTSTATAIVTINADAPVVGTTGGSLTCLINSITIHATSSIDGSTFEWTGPNGFTSTSQDPAVDAAGIYAIEVTAPNGCETNSVAVVEDDTDLPGIDADLGVADCEAGTRTLSGNSNGVDFLWTGPNGFTSSSLNTSTSLPGTYILTSTGANGCIASDSIFMEFPVIFQGEVSTTNATETEGGTASISITGGTPVFTVLWDNGQTGNSADDLAVGGHTVTVTDGLGCVEVYTFSISQTLSVDVSLDGPKIILYPNPASDEIIITKTSGGPGFERIDLYDVNGKLMKTVNTEKSHIARINVSNLSSGMYYVVIRTAEGLVNKYFLKI